MINDRPIVKFAVPKKGRLYDKIIATLNGAGFKYTVQPRLDIAFCSNFPLQLVFLPASDIATFVGQGDIDLGITGQDIVAESDEDVEEILKLGFGKCKLCVLTPEANKISNAAGLVGKRLCTSFPNLTKKFFTKLENAEGKCSTQVKFVSGSVEAACSLGLSDGVVDLVESGTTMKAAGLELIDVIMETQAVLIGNKKLRKEHKEVIEIIRKRISGYLTAQQYKIMQYNIPKSRLAEAKVITPGKRAPTVSAIDEEGWAAVSVMVENTQVASVMDRLLEIGATDIFTLQMDNYRN